VKAGARISMSRRRRWAFIGAAVLLSILVPLAALLGADAFLHTRFQRTGGVNIWGYRGPVAHRKQAGEHRIAMLGGSSAFGYGVGWTEAIPARLESKIRGAGERASVVNLAYNNEGAYSFRFTLADYLYLDYDLAILYEGYNDLMGDPRKPNFSVFRHESPVFRVTGYLPILPLIFREKAASMLYRGNIGQMYEEARTGKKVVFDASLADRAKAGALNATAAVGDAIQQQLGRMSPEPPPSIPSPNASGCPYPWAEYCQSVLTAVEFGLQHDRRLLVVTQPYLLGNSGARHESQQQAMADALRRRFGADRRVAYFNAGAIVDLTDPALSFDQMHLTALGNERVASALAAPVRELLASR
jgi:lysophospholipase L1-like esterase